MCGIDALLARGSKGNVKIPPHVPVKVNTVTCAGKGFVTPIYMMNYLTVSSVLRIILIIYNGSCSTVLITNQLREILVYHDKILQYLVTDIVAIYPKVLWRIQGMVQILTGARPEDCK